MTDREIYKLYKEIENGYYACDYETTLNLLKQYFKLESVGITDKLLNIYIDCNIGLSNYEEALRGLKLVEKLYLDTYNKYFLVKRYIDCFNFEEAVKIIDNNVFTDKQYYNIAKKLLLSREYYLSKKYFDRCILITDKTYLIDKSNKYIEKIKKYFNEDKFIEQGYIAFKRNGNTLEPGHVIYAQVTEEKYKSIDTYCNKRTYMVWKVVDNNVYCFPITTKVKNNNGIKYGYTLFCKDYLNFDSDRRIKERLVIIEESNIEKVYEKITKEDFKVSLKYLYQSVCFFEPDEREKNKELINEYLEDMNITKGDIIVLYGAGLSKKKYYFVLDIEKKLGKYEAVEIIKNNGTRQNVIKNYDRVYIQNSDPIYCVIKLTDQEKEELNEDLKSNQKPQEEKKLILK